MCVAEVSLPKTTAQGGMILRSLAGKLQVLCPRANGCEGEEPRCFGDTGGVPGGSTLPFLCSAPG